MTEQELQDSLRQTAEENKAKVRELLRAKTSGIKIDNTPKSYEEAKQAGDIGNMLSRKLGIVDAQRREQELEKVMNTDIKTVVSELNEVDGKISNAELKLNSVIEQLTEQYEQEFRSKTKGLRGDELRYAILRGERDNKIDAITSLDDIKALSNSIGALKERKSMLAKAKAHYINTNKDLIAEARRAKIMSDINASGLLADID